LMNSVHQPVMLQEAVELLKLKPGDTVLDATLGAGGHSREMLKRITPGGRLIGLDNDAEIIELTTRSLGDLSGSFKFINENFRNLDAALAREGVGTINAAIFDLGVSSYQLDRAERGFSLRKEAPLDMRMDPRAPRTAYDIVNNCTQEELDEIIFKYGEERLHRKVARFIVENRAVQPIATTTELAEIVHRAVGYRFRDSRIDPATRTFQAIRIAVNDELGALEEGLKKIVSWLDVGGRVAVITFHSLEDRIVKNLFRGFADLGFLKLVTKKPVQATREEVLANPRARSAKLRVAERM
jgi:16S rRNA (cytosine1402-N4)-methyltransferase